MLVKAHEEPKVAKELTATICWMDKDPLQTSSRYYLKHGVNDVQAKVMNISSLIHTDFSGKQLSPSQLTLNEIGEVQLKLSKPVFFDSYEDNKANGTFILIDSKTNNTAGVGFIN